MKLKRITARKLNPPRAKWKKFWRRKIPETGAGDLKQLQAAIAALDEITKPLADLLMDKAMEAMLTKRGLIQ